MVQTSRSGETKASQNPSFPAIDVQRGHSYGASNNNNNNGPVDRRTSKFKDYSSERNSLKAKRRRRRQSTASSGSSSGSGDSDDSSLPEAPNGGWGWAVVVASFIVHLIADGCSFSFGVIYAELLDYFDESKSKTAWVGSLFISIPMLAGPIASAATNRYGCRVTTIVGGFLAGLGFVLSFFAPNIEVLCVTFGLISGFGLALVYVPAVVIVAYYFEERRAFATGVAVAGSGIGTFLFAPLTDLLIETYGGWRGAVLVLGGVMMNISVCGMIFRSLEDNNDSDSESGDSSSDDETTSSGKAAHRSHTGQSLEAFSRWSSYAARINEPNARHDEDRHRHVSGRSNGGEAGDCVTFQLDPEVEQMLEEPVSQSLVLFPTYLQGEINVMSGDVIKELKESGKTLRDILTDHNLLQLLYERHTLDELMASVAESLNKSHEAINLDLGPEEEECLDGDPGTTFGRPVTMSECEDPSTSVARRSNLTQGGRRLVQRKRRNTHRQHVRMRVIHPLNRKDIFYRGNVRKDIFYRHNLRSVFNVRPPMARAASCPDVIVHVAASDVSEEGRCGLLQLSHEVKQIMSEMLDISILKTFSFLYFCASCMLLYSAYDVPYVYAPDTVSEMFSTKLASYVLSVIGIASTIGQILIGYIGDLPEVNTMHLYNFCVSMAGLCTCFVPLLTQYWMFCVYGALYGLFISANYSLTTIIIVNLFGMSKLTNAYGIINMAQGAANLVGPPLAGYIADVTDSYDLAFYLAGITMIVSGLMLFAVPCIKKYDPKSRLASRVTSAHELQSVASRRGSAPVVSGASAVPNAVATVTDGKVTDQAPPSPSPSR